MTIFRDILAYIFDNFAVGCVVLARIWFWHIGCKCMGVGNYAAQKKMFNSKKL